MHCRLLVPLPAGDDSLAQLPGRRFPALELLLARGRRSVLEVDSREQWLMEGFGVARQEDWPSGPFALLGDGGAPGDDFWMHADPAHFTADRDRLMVGDGVLLDLSQEEASELVAVVNGHFGDALQLQAPHPARWYARVASPPPGPTMPLRQAAGRAVDTGAGSIQWHALMNEIQMLLHEHPVNETREARGAPAVNGVWLWGGGRLAAAKPDALRSMAARDPLASGLARSAGIAFSALPKSAESWLARPDDDGVHLAMLDEGGAAGLVPFLEALEQRWAVPLVAALRSGRIGMVTLHLELPGQMLQAEATASDLRRVWRSRRPIDRYLK